MRAGGVQRRKARPLRGDSVIAIESRVAGVPKLRGDSVIAIEAGLRAFSKVARLRSITREATADKSIVSATLDIGLSRMYPLIPRMFKLIRAAICECPAGGILTLQCYRT